MKILENSLIKYNFDDHFDLILNVKGHKPYASDPMKKKNMTDTGDFQGQ